MRWRDCCCHKSVGSGREMEPLLPRRVWSKRMWSKSGLMLARFQVDRIEIDSVNRHR